MDPRPAERGSNGPQTSSSAPPGKRKTSRWDAAIIAASMVLTVLALARVVPSPSAKPAAAPSASAAPSPGSLPKGAPSVEPDTEAPISGCFFPDRGFGAYGNWQSFDVPDAAPNDVRRLAKVLVPPGAGLRADGGFDLLVHFHGAEPVRKELAPMGLSLVVVAIDAGTRSSHYGKLLAEQGSFDRLISAIEQHIARASSRADTHAAHLAVSSWSAGYAAVTRALAQSPKRIGAIVLLDSLYASYAPNQRDIAKGALSGYVEAAREAARGGAPFYLSHSGVRTDGYASTSEVATALLDGLGATSVSVAGDVEEEEGDDPSDHAPLRLVRMYDAGRFVIRGYAGAGPDDHCAHLRLLKRALTEDVLPAFH
ncbi:MAG: hypothetical protein IPK82_32265 [Polyangiaceae bacterium]|nr:hypothetical protein [Polyangiaceae bacterium]